MIPWRTIRSWSCLMCGRCCTGYRVDLSSNEYTRIKMHWPYAIRLGKWGNPCLVQRGEVCIFLKEDRSCGLQRFGMKPFACKVWPFIVHSGYGRGDVSEAEFDKDAGRYYVYIHPGSSMCPGIDRGDPALYNSIISEVVEISRNPFREQVFSTSKKV